MRVAATNEGAAATLVVCEGAQAIVCNLLGTTSYIAVMKYFEPVVVSTVMLMEPVLAALMGAAAAFDTLPGLQTWIGDGIVTIGIVLVIWSGARTTETIDATEALLQVGGAETLSYKTIRWAVACRC